MTKRLALNPKDVCCGCPHNTIEYTRNHHVRGYYCDKVGDCKYQGMVVVEEKTTQEEIDETLSGLIPLLLQCGDTYQLTLCRTPNWLNDEGC